MINTETKLPREVNGFPRRNIMEELTEEEKMLLGSIEHIENLGADERLTNAVVLIGEALNELADFLEGA